MRKFLITFILYVYTNYVYEDFDIYKSHALYLAKILWLYYAICIWVVSPLFIPEFLFKQSKFYSNLKKIKSQITNKQL
jgi:hypothetical protein